MSQLFTISCPSCAVTHKVTDVLEHCATSWPEQHLLYFCCPRCRSNRHVRVLDDRLAVGYLDVTPGPRFVAQAEVAQPGLNVCLEDDGIEVSLGEQSWFIVAKD